MVMHLKQGEWREQCYSKEEPAMEDKLSTL